MPRHQLFPSESCFLLISAYTLSLPRIVFLFSPSKQSLLLISQRHIPPAVPVKRWENDEEELYSTSRATSPEAYIHAQIEAFYCQQVES